MMELATAKAPMAWKVSNAALQMRNTAAHRIRVVLQLSGRKDREERGLAGCLIASMGAIEASEAPHAITALIHIDGPAGRPRIGEPDCPTSVALNVLEQLRLALDAAWQTGKNVDLLDEHGRPLLLGALHAHPAGVSRWLTHSLQDGR